MFRIEAGRSPHYCDGLSRRSFVQMGLAGMGSLGLADVFRARQASAETAGGTAATARGSAKDTSVILIWLDGGPSHIDLYDLKPEAPAEYRGIWSPIHTNVPGIDISELFPLQARMADKFSIIRSLHHDNGDHFTGRPLDAHRPRRRERRQYGRQVPVHRGSSPPRLPARASLACRPTWRCPMPRASGCGRAILAAIIWAMSTTHSRPTATRMMPSFSVQNLKLPGGLSIDRLEDRRGLLEHFDRLRRDLDSSRSFDAIDRFQAAGLRTGGRQQGGHGVRSDARGRQSPRTLRPHDLGTKHAACAAARRGRLHVRHGPLRRLGSSLGPEGGHGSLLARRRPPGFGPVRGPARPRLARQGAGAGVRRIRTHAQDERWRQRRAGRQQRHARPRSLGQCPVLPDRRRRRERRSDHRFDQFAGRSAQGPARSRRAICTPRSFMCWASIRTRSTSTVPAARSPPCRTEK